MGVFECAHVCPLHALRVLREKKKPMQFIYGREKTFPDKKQITLAVFYRENLRRSP